MLEKKKQGRELAANLWIQEKKRSNRKSDVGVISPASASEISMTMVSATNIGSMVRFADETWEWFPIYFQFIPI